MFSCLPRNALTLEATILVRCIGRHRCYLLFLAGCVLSLLGGCAPLQQIEWKSSNERIRISPGVENLAVVVFTQPATGKDRPLINEHASYAENSTNRYKIRAVVNTYADQYGGAQRSWYVYLRGSPAPGSSWPPTWSNGTWRLHLEFSGSSVLLPPIDAEFRLWTFFYSPLIHGAPN